MSAFCFEVAAGVIDHFLLTYDYGREQEGIEETRKQLARLTAPIERWDNQD